MEEAPRDGDIVLLYAWGRFVPYEVSTVNSEGDSKQALRPVPDRRNLQPDDVVGITGTDSPLRRVWFMPDPKARIEPLTEVLPGMVVEPLSRPQGE